MRRCRSSPARPTSRRPTSSAKTDRVRPVAADQSELEIVEASIRETVDGRDMIRKQPFVRIRATLATAATALSEDVPAYDPVAMIDATQPIIADADSTRQYRYLRRRGRGRSVDQARRHAADASCRRAPSPTRPPPTSCARRVESVLRRRRRSAPTARSPMPPTPTPACAIWASSTPDGVAGVAENVTVCPRPRPPKKPASAAPSAS